MHPMVNNYLYRQGKRKRWFGCISPIILIGLGVVVAVPLVRTVAGSSAPSLVGALANCDRSLFSVIYGQRDRLGEIAKTKRYATSSSYIAVENRSNSGLNSTRFVAPYQDGELVLNGYFDEVENLGADQTIYSWGFLALGSVNDVSRLLGPDTLKAWSLHREGNVLVRTEVWDGKKWVINVQDPQEDQSDDRRVERIFSIEEVVSTASVSTRIGCSLQGRVTASLLASVRPDL